MLCSLAGKTFLKGRGKCFLAKTIKSMSPSIWKLRSLSLKTANFATNSGTIHIPMPRLDSRYSKCGHRPATSAGAIPGLLRQKLQRWRPAVWILTSPPGDSDVFYHLKITRKNLPESWKHPDSWAPLPRTFMTNSKEFAVSQPTTLWVALLLTMVFILDCPLESPENSIIQALPESNWIRNL